MPHFPAQLSTSAPSHHAPSLAAFITNIAGSDFSVHTTANELKAAAQYGKDF
jgi:hypothetical protein